MNNDESKFSVLYTSALNESLVFNNPDEIKKLKNKNKIKIAFVGDSITEGMDIPQPYNYVEQFAKKCKGTKFEIINMAIGGRNLENFNQGEFTALYGSEFVPHPMNFWKWWAIEGRSWVDCVKIQNPDLLIVCFGPNDERNGHNNTLFYKLWADNTQAHFKDICPVIWITPPLPANNPLIGHLPDRYAIKGFGNVIRESSYNYVDIQRVWEVMDSGTDSQKCEIAQISSFDEMLEFSVLNFKLNINIKNYDSQDNTLFFRVRTQTNRPEQDIYALGITFYKGENEAYCADLFQYLNWNKCLFIKRFENLHHDISLIVNGSNISINGDNVSTFSELVDGYLFFSEEFKKNIDEFELFLDIPFHTNYYIPWETIYGEGGERPNTGFLNGDGLLHPSQFGHSYGFSASMQKLFDYLESNTN